MKLDRTGATRMVILTQRWAFKIPNFGESWGDRWRLFLHGLLANQQEYRFWSRGGYPQLCPVKFYLPLGFLVVMPRVTVLTDREYAWFPAGYFTEHEDYCIPAEDKATSFGWLGTRIVCIDYGN